VSKIRWPPKSVTQFTNEPLQFKWKCKNEERKHEFYWGLIVHEMSCKNDCKLATYGWEKSGVKIHIFFGGYFLKTLNLHDTQLILFGTGFWDARAPWGYLLEQCYSNHALRNTRCHQNLQVCPKTNGDMLLLHYKSGLVCRGQKSLRTAILGQPRVSSAILQNPG
jgi:hypothetical protein